MKKFLIFISIALIFTASAAFFLGSSDDTASFEPTLPRDNERLIDSPAMIRANFTALKAMIDQIYIDYSSTTEVALKADKSYVDANFSPTGEVALKAYSADVYTTDEIDLKFLNHYTKAEIDLKFNGYYTTGEVDAKLLLKLDASEIASYYNKTDIDQLLLDKASTAAVALKADKIYVDETDEILFAAISQKADKSYVDANFSPTAEVALKANKADSYTTGEINLMLDDKADTGSVSTVSGYLAAHTAEVSAHGRKSPVGQIANRLEVTDGAGGWMLTSVAAAGGGVTNAIDLNVDASQFSRILNNSAVFAQTALDQIDENAATTAEVAAKATPAQVSQEVLIHNENTTNIHGIADTGNLATKAMTSEEVAVHNEDTNAHLAKFAAIPLATAIEDTATFISSNVFEFSDDYDTIAVVLYRNGIMQPRRLFTTADVASKTRVTFISAVNDSDEIILISNK